MTHSVEPSRDPGLLLSRLLSESEQLRADVADRERRNRRLVMLVGAGVVLALLMIVSVVVLLVQSRQRGADTRALIRANSSTNAQIADCTSPTGKCYQEGAKRSAALIQQLIEAQKQIALCRAQTADNREAVTDLNICIDKALEPVLGPKPSAPTGSKP